ncbi:uncharacterized protein LOC142171947 [Nicotiana tabacum]|uniref:Uncharacterized protein LOC142171947 n=1 Tax=Nicotiana tabacum TaxID=4097 RepID=A0AC58T3L7_TOBAC
MPECNTRFLTEGISDHCPAKVTFVNERQRSKRSFQFCNVWTQHPQFMNIVNEGWNYTVEGCRMFTVVRRLKMLKKRLKALNNQIFHNIVAGANEDRNTLKQAQIQLQRCPTSLEYQQAKVNQMSKVTWIRLEDDNTKYFYSVIKHMRLKQATTQLNDSSGVWQINATNIALIPKAEVPENAAQYRPISRCNVLYKCISKMICTRLKPTINHIVADNQLTFVQGRSMMYNVLICRDLLRHYNRKTTPRCLMKIDFRKAYDMISWEFLEKALK